MMKSIDKIKPLLSGVLGGLLLSATAVHADDTEVFYGQLTDNEVHHPNLLFILDSSDSMTNKDGIGSMRITRLREAFDSMIDSTKNINVGVMRLNGRNGGGSVIFPMSSMDEVVCETAECSTVEMVAELSHIDDDGQEDLGSGVAVDLAATELSLGATATGDSTRTALRFRNIDIPSGVHIVSATLKLGASQAATDAAHLTVRGEFSGNSEPLNAVVEDLSVRDSTAAAVDWIPSDWTANTYYESPDLSTVLQEIVNQDDWCGGHSFNLMIEGTGHRNIHSLDGDASFAPVLDIKYDLAPTPADKGCVTRTFTTNVKAGVNDADQVKFVTTTLVDINHMYAPKNGTKLHFNGLRFPGIAIPQGAAVQSANITLTNSVTKTGNVTYNFRVQKSDNPGQFQPVNKNITKRALMPGSVNWSNPDGTAEARVTTSDLTALVQSIVNRAGWKSGNAMVFRMSTSSGSGTRQFYTYNNDPSKSAVLNVEYKINLDTSKGEGYATGRSLAKLAVQKMRLSQGTPLVMTLHEAARYARGLPVVYGKVRGKGFYRQKENRVSHEDSYTGGHLYRPFGCDDSTIDDDVCKFEAILDSLSGPPVYNPYIESSCQTNHIVMLSDGAPTSDNNQVGIIESLIGSTCAADTTDRMCGHELAEWLNTADHASGVPGTQNITVHTIGFNLTNAWLENLAYAGGGQYYEATTANELSSVFSELLSQVMEVDTSFVAPGATVNQFNRLTHRNDIYFSLFKPMGLPRWHGNLKKYKLGAGSGDAVTILDANGNAAVDPATGSFDSTAQSYWSDVIDGNTVELGGAAGRISPTDAAGNTRRIYTYGGSNPSNVALNNTANLFHEDNAAMLSKSALGVDAYTDAQHLDLIKFVRGVDVTDVDSDGDTTEAFAHIGDPLHSQPVLINYGSGEGASSVIFISTNEGLLHAVDHETGDEVFAFYPKELWGNAKYFYENDKGRSHPYGLDGAISVRHDDSNLNGVVDNGEKAVLYFGMRRGGRNYYALDVSSKQNPVLKWVIKGGPSGSTGFGDMGQTWSKAKVAKIRHEGQFRDVLIFGGGYDTHQDEGGAGAGAEIRRKDNMGNTIYIVDADTGEKIWTGTGAALDMASAGVQTPFVDMDYSIPSEISVLDVDGDQLVDQMYVGDMGGQLWRFDVNNYASTPEQLVSGGVMADFSEDSSPEGTRRFYYPPDLGIMTSRGKKFLSVSIGSGWRAHPLDTVVQDRFYMLRVDDLFKAPEFYGRPDGNSGTGDSVYTTIKNEHMMDITNDLSPELDWTQHSGWRLDLEASGEKVMSSSVTIDGKIVFTSYLPGVASGPCSVAIGGGRVYVVNLLDGTPAINLVTDEEESLTKTDRYRELNQGGIPPTPSVLIPETGEPILLVGPEQPVPEMEFGEMTRRTYWHEVEASGQ